MASREFAVGDRIIFGRNSRQLGVKNGQLGTLESWHIDPRGGNLELTIRLDNGAAVVLDPAEYGHIDHGYAMSVHKSQGVTADNVSVLISESMTDQEWSYVAVSRHRERLRVFVPEGLDEGLSQSMGRSRQKSLASDYLVASSSSSLDRQCVWNIDDVREIVVYLRRMNIHLGMIAVYFRKMIID